MAQIDIRPETPADLEFIRNINDRAFGRPEEGQLVDALRSNGKAILSLVAWAGKMPVGHVLFFPVTIEGENGVQNALGLGPMAVIPDFQKQGVGTQLVRQGIELMKNDHEAVIVLGHPEFYSRFGFQSASQFGIRTHYEVPDEVFMALALREKGLDGKSGTVIYSTEFDAV